MEYLSASDLSAVLQISKQGVRSHFHTRGIPAERNADGLMVWPEDCLPDGWRKRIALAKRLKGCDTIAELLTCRARAGAHFGYTVADASDYEKKFWPIRKEALREYYRARNLGEKASVAEARACKAWLVRTGQTIDVRTVRRWLNPVEKCGGFEHAPDEAYVRMGRRRTLAGPPAETIAYFGVLVRENQRKFSSAWRKLVEQLQNWRATGSDEFRIPGYDTAPGNAPGSDLPLRWSYKYFTAPSRRPSPAQVAASRQGEAALARLCDVVRSSRVGVKVGEIIYFDDQEYDVKVNVLGINKRATRPLGLDALDYASACVFSSFYKPTVFDDEERARKMLRQVDMVWFVVQILTEFGYRVDENGTEFVVEHGTAAIPNWLKETIRIVTNGKVTVKEGGLHGKALPGLFEGSSKGNPQFKAALESARNRLRNDMADMRLLPGATGMDRNHAPDDLHGRDRYNNLLLKVWNGLPPDQRPDFHFPFVEWRHFGSLANAYVARINHDPEHELQGWNECGNVTQEWRLDHDAPWQSLQTFAALDPARRALVSALLDANPNLTRVRKLSRWEVWQAGKTELTRLPEYLIPQLLTHQDAPPFYKLRRVNESGRFEFEDRDADPYGGQFVFLARLQDRAGHEVKLTCGETYQTFLNPLSPGRLLVCRQNGGYLGSCAALDPASANDPEAIGKLLGLHSSLMAENKTDLAQAGVQRTRELARMKMHNEGLMNPGKTARARQIEDATSTLAEELYAS